MSLFFGYNKLPAKSGLHTSHPDQVHIVEATSLSLSFNLDCFFYYQVLFLYVLSSLMTGHIYTVYIISCPNCLISLYSAGISTDGLVWYIFCNMCVFIYGNGLDFQLPINR